MVCIAVIGYGYWGPNIVRNLVQKKCRVKYVIDIDEVCCKKVSGQYPDIMTSTDVNVAISDSEVDCAIIVLPAKLHFSMAMKFIEAGKNVLIEKPLATNSNECKILIEAAAKKNVVLMVDHTYLYSAAVRKMKEIIAVNDAKVLHIYSNRSNLGVFRKDVNVMWDLAPHDLSIIEYISDKKPLNVTAIGSCHSSYGVEDFCTAAFDYGDFVADIVVSWISPEKVRHIEILTDKFIMVFDDLEKEEKIRIYDAGMKADDVGRIQCYNNGMKKIRVDEYESLSGMLDDFISAVCNGTEPVSNSKLGLDTVSALESSDDSISKNGEYVAIKYD